MYFTDDFLANYRDTWIRCPALQGFRPNRWLEVGTWEGRSACWMMEHILAPGGEIHCVDPLDYFPEQDERAKNNLTEAAAKYGCRKRIFRATLPEVAHKQAMAQEYDGAYIDGPKDYASCLETSRLAWKKIRPGGVIIWDDIHWHEDRRVHDETALGPVGFAVLDFLQEVGLSLDSVAWHTTQAVAVKPARTTTRCLVDIAFGETFLQEQRTTEENHRIYAEKCGANYIQIKGMNAPNYGCAGKLAIQPILDEYDQTLYLDCDVVVTHRAPNIFDEVPVGWWAGVDELGCVHVPRDQWQNMADAICDAALIPRVRLPFMFNGGVGMMPRGGGWILQPPQHAVPGEWTFDQIWWSIQLVRWEQKTLSLDRRYQQNPWMPDPTRSMERAFFIHHNDSERMTRWRRLADLVETHGVR